MTFLLILGLFAGLALFRLLCSLTIAAMPLSGDIAVAVLLHSSGGGVLSCLAAGGTVACLLAAVWPALLGSARNPALRLAALALYVLPAVLAGAGGGFALGGLVARSALLRGGVAVLCGWLAGAGAARRLLASGR